MHLFLSAFLLLAPKSPPRLAPPIPKPAVSVQATQARLPAILPAALRAIRASA
jgi:hypothetical protein